MTGWRKRQILECEMTDREAMAMALEALETLMIERGSIYEKAITALKERLAQPEQEPICPKCKATVLYECVACSSNNYPPQRTEQNFCSRCGKRTPDLITIHTCTPPKD
jgi:hypothetical protein